VKSLKKLTACKAQARPKRKGAISGNWLDVRKLRLVENVAVFWANEKQARRSRTAPSLATESLLFALKGF
jgi:hypothetical protein